MKVMQRVDVGGNVKLALAEVAQPRPGTGQILVHVHAAGVIHTELGWQPTTHTKAGGPRERAVPGHEFSGVVAELGADAAGFTVGQAVYGMNDWYDEGASAEACLTNPSSIAAKPARLDHIEAASVPISALTAWQGLDRVHLERGERVLIHGGAGGVGLFAVQLARERGARVIATVSARNIALVRDLGADEVIDHRAVRFEDVVQAVDVVFDTVGGATRDRSWKVLGPGGRLVTIVSDVDDRSEARLREAFFIVEPSAVQLAEMARLIDAGRLRTFVNAVLPLAEAASAYAEHVPGERGHGKTVIQVVPASALR